MKKFLVTSLSAVVVLSVLSACAPKKRVTNPAQPAGDTSVEDVTGLKAAPAPATDAQLDIPQKIVSENSNDLSKGNRLGVTITRPEAGDIRVETLNQGEGKVETSVVNTKTGVPGKVHFSELSTNGAARNVVAEILNDEGKLVKIEVFSWNEKSLKVVGKLNVKDMPEQDLGITDASFTVIRYTEDGAVAPFDTLEINKIVDESKKTSTKPLEVTSTIKNEKIKTLFHNIPEIKDKEGNT
ncbi:MAG: hypothetical protein SGI74_14715, partial [Oligoflexia bacterium]|nr:hypothetical protein [Oligoflexia bacterium]